MSVAALPILTYGRAPARRGGRESVRTLREPGRATVAVFPPGARRGDFWSVLAGALLAAGALTGATIWFWRHPVPLARQLGAVWPLAALLLFFLAMLAAAYDAAFRQVEFEIDAHEIARLSFGPFGVRRRRWERGLVREVRVERHISGSHPRVVLVTRNGRNHDVLCPGSAGGLLEDAERAAEHLSDALGFASSSGGANVPTANVVPDAPA